MRPRAGGDTYQATAKAVEDMVADGWSAGQVVTQVSHTPVPSASRRSILLLTHAQRALALQAVVYDELIPDANKNKIVLVFSEVDKRLVDGADEHLSILDLALRISAIMAER